MDNIELNLAQVLAIAWVWQCEVRPKYMPHWKKFDCGCGMYRKAELHVAAYNRLLEQVLSDARSEDLKYTKGAMSMLAFHSLNMVAFEPAMPFRRDDREWNDCAAKLRELVPGRIIARERIVETPVEDLREAKWLIRRILSVDKHGKLLYCAPVLGCMVFTPSHTK